MLSKPGTAVRGNQISALGMLIAIVATLLQGDMDYTLIIAGILLGGVIGTIAAVKVPMTAMPEFVALFNGSGGLASLLVGWAEYHKSLAAPGAEMDVVTIVAIYLAVLIGGVTFTGSVVAYAKLAERLSGKPFLFSGQQIVNAVILVALVLSGIVYVADPGSEIAQALFFLIVALSLVLGLLVTLPIGGADMPVVISLLNSYSGLAACAAGFVISNTVLIVAGSLVGASGYPHQYHVQGHEPFPGECAVQRIWHGRCGVGRRRQAVGEVKPASPEDAYYVLEAASSVVFVPGYGMAVAQAQHAVRELGDLLVKNGADVKYAVHPVAGRMPGHMNVLLAEANVPYEELVEMDDINPVMESVDVCMVIARMTW